MRKLLITTASALALLVSSTGSPAFSQETREDPTLRCTVGAPAAVNVLCSAYTVYVRVKLCNEVRKGYLLQYVNDDEMERATIAIRAIADKALNVVPNLDTDAIWQRALRLAGGSGWFTSQSYCQLYLRDILANSPVDTFKIQKP